MEENRERKYLAVLLTVHNRVAITTRCLKQLYEQDLPPRLHADVYVVDDGSTDGTAQTVKDQFPQVNIIQGDGSLYWNRGMYTAWKTASQSRDYDYYLWLNDDTMLFKQAIGELLALSNEYNDEIIAVGATKATNSEKLTYGGRKKKHIMPCDGVPHEVEQFNGNVVLIPKRIFHVLGNLDYYYTHSKGDIDYGIRAGKHRIKMLQCGNVLGICDEHEKMDSWCNPEVPFRKRWCLMNKPTGMPPHETFHLEKQINMVLALVHLVTIPMRCLFPKLWIRLKANKA